MTAVVWECFLEEGYDLGLHRCMDIYLAKPREHKAKRYIPGRVMLFMWWERTCV